MKILKVLFFGLLGVLLLLLGMSAWFSPEGFPAGSVTDQRAAMARYLVHTESLQLVDPTRVTQARNGVAEASGREFKGKLFAPISQKTSDNFPLLIYSHGFSSSHRGGVYLGEYLAAQGFVVAMIDFPLTNMQAEGGPYVKDVVNQPSDVSFLIDQLLARNTTPGDTLFGIIDSSRIGAMGVSLGGFTSTLLGYHPTLADARIGAIVSIAGPSSLLMPRFFETRSLPFMMIAGTYDVLVPYETNALPITEKVPNAWLVSIDRASHTAFAGPTAAFRFLDNVDVLGCWAVLRATKNDLQEPWYDLLGDASTGINENDEVQVCTEPVPDAAMNVIQQQWITQVTVGAFFDLYFSHDPEVRAQAEQFLATHLSQDVTEVSVIPPALVQGTDA